MGNSWESDIRMEARLEAEKKMKEARRVALHIESRFLRAVISVVIASILAHIPMIFSFLLFCIPVIAASDTLPVGILLAAVVASIATGIGTFRWVYKRLGAVETGV